MSADAMPAGSSPLSPGPFPPKWGERGGSPGSKVPLPLSPEIGGKGDGGIGGAACAGDADCGYDPSRGACGDDPRYNRQPPIIDQGILCYCEEGRCATLNVPPVPCESDASCAVRADPRPHPVAASADFPHERGKPCKDYRISTTCERTNICTLHRHACKGK